MDAEAAEAEDEIDDVVAQLGVGQDLAHRLVEGAHVAHDADQMNAFEYHLGRKQGPVELNIHSLPYGVWCFN